MKPPAVLGRPDGGRHAEGKLAGILKRNPTTALGIAGAAAVVAIALMRRSGTSQDMAPGTTTAQTAGGVYDSTANDVYNSIESQLQAMYTAIGALNKPPGSTTPTPTTPKPKPPAKPKVYYSPYKVKKGQTWAVLAKLDHVSVATIKALNPKIKGNPKAGQTIIGVHKL